MGSLVYTLVSMVQVASLHCSMRQEISPCSCAPHEVLNDTIHVTCEGLASFNQVFDSLQNKFSNRTRIWLTINKSQLDDLETRNFRDMNINITKLTMSHDDLRTLPESSFRNLSNLGYLSLANNNLKEIPRHILSHMPKIVTVDLGCGNIETVHTDDFQHLMDVRSLVLVSNNIKIVEKESIPRTVRMLHLGRNNLTSLNGTLRNIERLDVLFLNNNNLTTLDGELPIRSTHFKSLTAHHNKLQNLPQDLKHFSYLDTLYLSDNEIQSLDGVFSNASYIQTLSVYNNKIDYLARDEFAQSIELQELELANNFIRAINGSLLPLSKIRICNLSRNVIEEFQLDDVRGLKELLVMDLSHNRIVKVTTSTTNVVDQDLYFIELRLSHNLLKSLNGAMMNLNRLKTLDLSSNKLKWLTADDFIGLDELESLDISHNFLQTLEETAMTYLPKLERLFASYNNLTKLGNDFHGLPSLCFADLSNNHIAHISPDLVSKTRCQNHGIIDKLEILLQENPILCMDGIARLFDLMEAQETRLFGEAHCIVPKEEEQIETIVIAPVPEPIPELDAEPPQQAEMPVEIPTISIEDNELETVNQAMHPAEILSILMRAEHNATTIEILQTEATLQQTTEANVSTENNENSSNTSNAIDIPTNIEELSNTLLVPQTTTATTITTATVATTTTTTTTTTTPTTATPTTATITQNEFEIVVNNNNDNISISVLESSQTNVNSQSIADSTSITSSTSAMHPTEHGTPVKSSTPSVAEIILGEIESISKSPEPDNYIYETYSSVPLTVNNESPPIQPIDVDSFASIVDPTNEQLSKAEEPPETIAVDVATAA